MNDVNIYENSSVILERKIPKKIISWITIVILLFIFISIFGTCINYTKYENTIGIVKENTLSVFLEPKKISSIKRTLIVENEKYNFEIKSISEDYTIINNKNYYEVILDIKLDNKYKINNNILEIDIELGNTTLIKEIINFLKKGMM